MAGYFPGATPCGVWIVSTMSRTPRATRLEFPSGGRSYPNIEFDDADRHEPYLADFDRAGVKVFLQVEPANADVATLIDLVLGRYGRHPCVVGFGVDVEWNRTADYPKTGLAVDDATARAWEARVKSHDAGYRLFLKHWDEKWMPPTYRGDIIFVDDSQIFPDLESHGRRVRREVGAGLRPEPGRLSGRLQTPTGPGGRSSPTRRGRSARPSCGGSAGTSASSGSISR